MSEVFNIWYSLEDCKAWGTHVTESEKYMGYYCVEGTPDEETKGEDSPKEDDDVST